MTKKHIKILRDQAGGVSMIVAVLIMLLITLIVLAMAQNARNEQRQALDRQLSDQAYFNAESGVNDTLKYLADNPGAPDDKLDNCNFGATLSPSNPGNIVAADDNNKYTCVLYNKAPTRLVFDDIGVADSKVVPINPDGAMTTLLVEWDDYGDQNNVSGCNFSGASPQLPPSLPANCIGGVRIDVIPEVSAVSNRDALNRDTRSAFLLPGSNTALGAMAFAGAYPDTQGAVGIAKCNDALAQRKCSIRITGIPSKFTLRIASLYRATDVFIEGRDASGAEQRLRNAQIMVDSTGKANDVLRRIQVRSPANPQYRQAEFGIQTKDSLCKILDVHQGTVSVNDTHPRKGECKLDP